MNPLLQLSTCGQSYWLDNLTRDMIISGELHQRVTEQGLRGITSNPATFHQAIVGSSAYDPQIRQLVDEGQDLAAIYEGLTAADIQAACDILWAVYNDSDGVDGFVSLEVSPYLAHNPVGTVQEARRLWAVVDRPNMMIKIPGTAAGIPAIEEVLYEGINVNITLLFAIQDYKAVALTYMRALERRLAAGQPIRNVASVASFFLSRIDVLVDQLLGHCIQPDLRSSAAPRPEQFFGIVAIANAKVAYQYFRRLFGGARWQALEAQGARRQRPLWASTSTKDPFYHDTQYVESLIAPHTVNTMPAETIAAFAHHGRVVANALEADLAEAHRILADLARVGIDLGGVTRQLQNEGVQKFIEPFDALMQALAAKREALLWERISHQTLAIAGVQAAVRSAYNALDRRQFGRRLWNRDPWLWCTTADEAPAIRQRLGWLESVTTFRQQVADMTRFAADVKRQGYTHVVLLGMGGSSLWPEVCSTAFGPAPGWPDLIALDNTDPAAVHEVAAQVPLPTTLFLVASKSGTTTETLCFYRYFWAFVSQRLKDQVGEHFVAITDAGTPLAVEAYQQGFRHCFENPADIGGRYAALSYFGLVPMALLGIDIAAVLEGARRMQMSCGPLLPAAANPGLSLGALLSMAARHGRDKVTFVLAQPMQAFGAWVEQLLAESTGKDGQGLIPVIDEPLGSSKVYSPDRLFVSVRPGGPAEPATEEQLSILEKAGHPVVRITVPAVQELGAECLRWELATATAGALLGVNPFDEPDVVASKRRTAELLQTWQLHGTFGDDRPVLVEDDITVYGAEALGKYRTVRALLRAFVEAVAAPDYLALLPYMQCTPERHQVLLVLRLALRNRRKVATTLGYGPRYLHSTGQLHKGGPPTAVLLMFTAEAPEDLPIPGEPFGFATLQRAQALGDFRALSAAGRRVLRLHLGHNIEQGLQHIVNSVL
jgi:transaldolase/glucose-6-phosphate isomerase